MPTAGVMIMTSAVHTIMKAVEANPDSTKGTLSPLAADVISDDGITEQAVRVTFGSHAMASVMKTQSNAMIMVFVGR